MKVGRRISCLAQLLIALVSQILPAATITPADIGPPFAVQPFVGLMVMSGVTEPFFADLSTISLPSSTIVNVLGNLEAFDALGSPISSFMITGVTVMQGNTTLMLPLDTFSLTSPVIYTDTLNPSNQVMLVPSALNLAFAFNSNPSFQYSYTLTTTGIPNDGFLLYDDAEGPRTPEPDLWLPVALVLITLFVAKKGRVVPGSCPDQALWRCNSQATYTTELSVSDDLSPPNSALLGLCLAVRRSLRSRPV